MSNLENNTTMLESILETVNALPDAGGGSGDDIPETNIIDTSTLYIIAGQKSGSVLGDRATAEGYDTVASGSYSHAEGSDTEASGSYSHAEGRNTVASGSGAHAEGSDTEASGIYSHAEGRGTVASGYCAHAEGFGPVASGSHSHAEGYDTVASGSHSHAEGYDTVASGYGAHAEGVGGRIECNATGEANTTTYKLKNITSTSLKQLFIGALVRCRMSTNNGYVKVFARIKSVDIANATITLDSTLSSTTDLNSKQIFIYVFAAAIGNHSHSEGSGTIAASKSQHVQGEYNIIDAEGQNPNNLDLFERGKYAHIVGNGTSGDSRSNAHTLDWNGNAWYQGEIYIGGAGQDDTNAKVLATEERVTELINEALGVIENGTY